MSGKPMVFGETEPHTVLGEYCTKCGNYFREDDMYNDGTCNFCKDIERYEDNIAMIERIRDAAAL